MSLRLLNLFLKAKADIEMCNRSRELAERATVNAINPGPYVFSNQLLPVGRYTLTFETFTGSLDSLARFINPKFEREKAMLR